MESTKNYRSVQHDDLRNFTKMNKALSLRMDDYLQMGLLGKGSFGKVLRVKYLPTGKDYAMKIPSDLFDDTEVDKNEIEVVEKLKNKQDENLMFVQIPKIILQDNQKKLIIVSKIAR